MWFACSGRSGRVTWGRKPDFTSATPSSCVTPNLNTCEEHALCFLPLLPSQSSARRGTLKAGREHRHGADVKRQVRKYSWLHTLLDDPHHSRALRAGALGESAGFRSNLEEVLTISAETGEFPHTTHVHSSESKIFGPIFGKRTLLLYLELFFEPAASGSGQGVE